MRAAAKARAALRIAASALIIDTMTVEKTKQIATLMLIASIIDSFPRRVVLEADNMLALGLIGAVMCLMASGFRIRAALRGDPATASGS